MDNKLFWKVYNKICGSEGVSQVPDGAFASYIIKNFPDKIIASQVISVASESFGYSLYPKVSSVASLSSFQRYKDDLFFFSSEAPFSFEEKCISTFQNPNQKDVARLCEISFGSCSNLVLLSENSPSYTFW